jgi:hypothetical protein
MPFSNSPKANKWSKDEGQIHWFYPGLRTDPEEKIYAALTTDIEKLLKGIDAGDKKTLAMFEYSVPGNRKNWDAFLKSQGEYKLEPEDNGWNGDNFSYDTPEKRAFLIKQLKQYDLPKLFAKRPTFIRGLSYNRNKNNSNPQSWSAIQARKSTQFDQFKEFLPATFLTRLEKLYGELKNVNKNNNKNAQAMTPDAVLAEAEADVAKLNGYITKFFANAKPAVDNEYSRAALEFERAYVLKQLPTAKKIASDRTRKANVVVKVAQLNPVSRAVAKLAIRKNPEIVVNDDPLFKRLVLKNKDAHPLKELREDLRESTSKGGYY